MDFHVQLLPQCQPFQAPPRELQQPTLKVCWCAGQARTEVSTLRGENIRVEAMLTQANERVQNLQQVWLAAPGHNAVGCCPAETSSLLPLPAGSQAAGEQARSRQQCHSRSFKVRPRQQLPVPALALDGT